MKIPNILKFQSSGLVLLLVATFVTALVMPLLNYYFVFPRYVQEVVDETEKTAVRLTNHLAKGLLEEKNTLSPETVAKWTDSRAQAIIADFGLMKMKIFDHTGTVLYSSTPKDIGTINSHDYFHNKVVKGETFTKVVEKDGKNMEGELVPKDVVEIYVPMLKDSRFIGAFELYYDISATRKKEEKTFFSSMLLVLPIMAVFLGIVLAVVLILNKKIKAEHEIKQLLEEQKETLIKDQERQIELFALVQNAKRQWETTMDCVSDLVVLTDPNFLIKRCNNALTELTGLDYRQLLNRNFKEIIPDTSLEGGDTTIGESSDYFHQASGHWFYLSLFPVVETTDQAPGFVISMSDITALKTVTAKLEQTNRQIITNRNSLQKALDNISTLIGDAIEGESPKEQIPLSSDNKCWETLACGQKDCPCYGVKDVRCWQELGTFCRGEIQSELVQKFRSCPECNYFQAVTQDPATFISEQFNNLMFMLDSKSKELNEAYHELKQTQGQLLQQEKMASIGQLAAGVAHEINNPVGFIASNIGSLGKYVERLNGFIAFLEDSMKTVENAEIKANVASQKKKLKLDFILGDIHDLITESLDGCERVKKIVQDLKGFSRVDQAERQYAYINECIDTTLNMMSNEFGYKVKVEKELAPLPEIECYPQQLNQVFMNILINASHAIGEEGVITIKTWQDEEFLFTAISDTGCGMNEEHLKHIFEPFFTTKDVGKGTGLGLSIVYDIIRKNHNGDIEAKSEEGKGTTFTIKLPKGKKKG